MIPHLKVIFLSLFIFRCNILSLRDVRVFKQFFVFQFQRERTFQLHLAVEKVCENFFCAQLFYIAVHYRIAIVGYHFF